MSTITKGLFVTATVSATCAIFTTIAAAQRQVSAPAVTRADPARFLVEGNSEPDWLMAERALDDPTPWGKPSQGLACRLLLNGDYCDGEPVHAIVEVRNVSDAEISIPNVFDFDSKSVARLQVVGPDGKAVKTRQYESWDDSNFGPARFATLEPGQLKRAHFPDIRQHLEGRLATRGEYRLTYWHFGASRIRGARAKELAARSWKGTLKSNTVTLNRRPLRKEDLAVHEWGVFSVTSNLSHVNAGRKQEWESLPAYFYRQFPTWRLHWIPSAWDKPIVYFHSTRPQLQLEVSVDFPKGAPVVWWPACSKPFDDTPGRRPSPDRTGPLFRALHWSVHLGRWHPFSAGGRSLGGFRETSLQGLPEDHWLLQARDVETAAIVSTYGTNLTGRAPWTASHIDSEKFIYYDGLAPTPDYLRCVRSDPAVLKNVADFPLENVFIVQRADADKPVLFARVERLAPGQQVQVKFTPVAKDRWPAAGQAAVKAALVAAGLLESEAAGLVDIWSQRFFESEGLTAFYILPQSEYDRMLPLSITPAPKDIVRVGVALHSHLQDEPSLRRRAGELIAKLDDDDFKTRERATQQLAELGPVAFGLLRETIETTSNPEIKSRCEMVLQRFDARVYLEKAARESGVQQNP